MQISGTDDRNIVYINLLGSFLAVIFTVILHYPLIPVFSKKVNARIENEVVNVRRSYAIKVLYTLIIGFFLSVFFLFLEYDNSEEPSLVATIVAASLMVVVLIVLTLLHIKRINTILNVDKLQHRNADIEG